MTDRNRDPRFIGGIIVLGCALLILIVRIADWAANGARLQLGVAAMFLVAGAMLLSSSRREGTVDKD